jgi:hypothetical protein
MSIELSTLNISRGSYIGSDHSRSLQYGVLFICPSYRVHDRFSKHNVATIRGRSSVHPSLYTILCRSDYFDTSSCKIFAVLGLQIDEEALKRRP